MGYEDDGAALSLEGAYMAEQHGDLVAVESGGRLVENDDAGAKAQDLEDFDDLAFVGGKLGHQVVGIDAGAECFGEFRDRRAGGPAQRPAIDEPDCGQRLAAEEDVLGDGHLRYQTQLLIEGDDPLGGGLGGSGESDPPILEQDAAAVRPDGT